MATARLALASLIGVLVFAAPASALKWPGNPPVTIRVDATSMSSSYQQAAVFAEANWSTSSVIDMEPGTKGRKLVRVISSTLCAYACTSIHTQNGFTFADATVHINIAAVGTSEFRQQQVLCHELGHALGLIQHSLDLDSCMYATTAGTNIPNAHDYEQLELIYG
jgi:hypothetical protein